MSVQHGGGSVGRVSLPRRALRSAGCLLLGSPDPGVSTGNDRRAEGRSVPLGCTRCRVHAASVLPAPKH